jgi:hypothetical protein
MQVGRIELTGMHLENFEGWFATRFAERKDSYTVESFARG